MFAVQAPPAFKSTGDDWRKIAAPVPLLVEARPIIIDRVAANAKAHAPIKNGLRGQGM